MPDNTEILARCVRQLGEAHLRIAELEEENHRLHLLHDSHPENQALWMELAYLACTCMDDAEKQAEVFPDPNDHKDGCKYGEIHAQIKEAVKR